MNKNSKFFVLKIKSKW